MQAKILGLEIQMPGEPVTLRFDSLYDPASIYLKKNGETYKTEAQDLDRNILEIIHPKDENISKEESLTSDQMDWVKEALEICQKSLSQTMIISA